MMQSTEGDRREHLRSACEQPCKIHDPRSGKYISGITRDLSAGGMLLEFQHALAFKPGESVHVGVAMKRRQGLLLAKDMIEAVVVRSMQTADDRTLLAVKFESASQSSIQLRPDSQITRVAA